MQATDTETKILEFLRADSSEPVPTLAISKHVFGRAATTKQINPILYRMLAARRLVKTSDPTNGANPKWTVVPEQ
jgi:hypothetical protein